MTEIQASAIKHRITVPPGTPMGGYAGRVGVSQGEHDPLHVKTLAIRLANDPTQTIIITSVDLVGLEKTAIDEVKASIHDAHGIPVDNILVAATHTHSGPRNIALFGDPFDGHEEIYELIRGTISDSLTSFKPAIMATGRGRIPEVTFNRRIYDASSEHVDDECIVITVTGVDGDVMAVLYNFACHPVVMGGDNLLISADWVYYANQEIQETFPSAIPIFLQGATGNLNPVNTPMIGDVPKHDFTDCAEIGTPIGNAVVHLAANASTVDVDAVGGVSVPVSIPADDEEKDEIFTFASGVRKDGEFIVQSTIQGLFAGDIAIVGIPGELFSEISMNIKKEPGFRGVLLAGYANDYIGYIPTRQNYLAGGYEALMMSLSEGEGEIIENAATGILKNFKK